MSVSNELTVRSQRPTRPSSRGRPPRAAELAALHNKIRGCQRCALCETRTQAVPGIGPTTARVVFIGEAPGRDEDQQGEPFVGRSGRFLNELLASIGLRRQDIYITNVVKCRPVQGSPPGRNRAPSKEEIAACAPWLDAQLHLLHPEVIVTLGQIALSRIVPGRRLADVHGRAIRDGAVTVAPLYHPAMARYGPRWVEVLRRDFRRIRPLIHRQEGSVRTPKRSRDK